MKTLALCSILTLSALPFGFRQDDGPAEEASRQKVTTFFMFYGQAEEAMEFYLSLFDDAEVKSIDRYGPGESGEEGTVEHAIFSIAGQEFMCIDSSIDHGFTFTPAISLFVDCESEAELDELFEAFTAEGDVYMAPDNYGFSERFAWAQDRYGISWQLNYVGD